MGRSSRSTGLTLWIGRAGYPGSMGLNESSQGGKDMIWTFVPDRRSVAGGWSVGGWHAGDPAGDARSQGRGKLQAQLFHLCFGSCVRQGPTGVCQRLEVQPGPLSCISALMEDGEPSVQFSSVTFRSDSLQPHGLQHTRPPCPSPTHRVYSNSCPLSW